MERYAHDLSLFKPAVLKQARRYRKDSLHESEDIEQSCWMKILEMMPILSRKPTEDARRYAATALRNHVADIVNASAARNGINVKLRFDAGLTPSIGEDSPLSMEDMMDQAMCSLDGNLPEHQLPQDEIASYRELADHLLSWSNGKSEITQRLVREMIEPSAPTLKKWHRMTDVYPVYRSYHSIPPSSFAKIFGCSKVTIFRAMEEIRTYVRALGYDLNLSMMN